MNPHFKALEAAYQLHYYLCFKTHYMQPIFGSADARTLVREVLLDVCNREQYHLLEHDVREEHLRVLLSLKPNQTITRASKMLKGNLDREFFLVLPDLVQRNKVKKLLARGYFARSSGKANLEVVRGYVENQVAHHGYRGTWTNALTYLNPNFKSPSFRLAHSFCLLNYHLVLVTQGRASLFDEVIAPNLFQYSLRIAEKHGFAIERMGLLPDHLHLTLEARPDVSIEECARALLENTRHWMARRYSGVLKEANVCNVWHPSYYAGTVGEYTTAQIKCFLALR
jgi:putative transposase